LQAIAELPGQIDHRNYTTLSGILEDYNLSGCEEENFVLIAKEMGMILSEVFPEATRVQWRENGNQTWKYPLSWLPTFRSNHHISVISVTECCGAHSAKAKRGSRKFRSAKTYVFRHF